MRLASLLRTVPFGLSLALFGQQPVAPEFRFPPIAPAVQAVAAKVGIPTSGFDTPVDRQQLRPEDKVVALVDLLDGTKHQQWLVLLVAKELTPEEKARPPIPDTHLYSTNGYEHTFSGQLAALAIRTLGPVQADDPGPKAARKAKDQWSGAFVNSDYLSLGLNLAASANFRVQTALERISQKEHREVSLNWGVGPKPFPPEVVERTRQEQAAATVVISETEDRATAGALLALTSFFGTAINTPGLNEALRRVTDIPWFSLLGRLGRAPEINIGYYYPVRPLPPADWGLPADTEVYSTPFIVSLNGKSALNCQIAVIAPRPPFLTSAGIVGIAAQRPDGTGPHLSIRLLAARNGPGHQTSAISAQQQTASQ